MNARETNFMYIAKPVLKGNMSLDPRITHILYIWQY